MIEEKDIDDVSGTKMVLSTRYILAIETMTWFNLESHHLLFHSSMTRHYQHNQRNALELHVVFHKIESDERVPEIIQKTRLMSKR